MRSTYKNMNVEFFESFEQQTANMQQDSYFVVFSSNTSHFIYSENTPDQFIFNLPHTLHFDHRGYKVCLKSLVLPRLTEKVSHLVVCMRGLANSVVNSQMLPVLAVIPTNQMFQGSDIYIPLTTPSVTDLEISIYRADNLKPASFEDRPLAVALHIQREK